MKDPKTGDEGLLERTTLSQRCATKPRSADLLVSYAGRRRARGGRQPEVPGDMDVAWGAEDGWR